MNMLNRIIIEGIIDSVEEIENGEGVVRLTNMRGPRDMIVVVHLQEMMMSNFSPYMKKGKGLRAVGRIEGSECEYHVEAEHLEFKNFPKETLPARPPAEPAALDKLFDGGPDTSKLSIRSDKD